MQNRRLRRIFQGVSLAAFPVTIFYFSPAIPIMGLAHGVVSGSLLVFGVLFLTSIFFGRSFCSHLCPMGAWQDVLAQVRGNPVRRRWPIYLRWSLWALWIGTMAWTLVAYRLRTPGEPLEVAPLFATANGVSVYDTHGVIVLVAVVALFSAAALLLGRRGACKSICWMAPFMVLGSELGRRFGLPRRRLVSAPGSCFSCQACARHCPMSLNPEAVAHGHVQQARECILCGECLPACPGSQLRIEGPVTRSRPVKALLTGIGLLLLFGGPLRAGAQPLHYGLGVSDSALSAAWRFGGESALEVGYGHGLTERLRLQWRGTAPLTDDRDDFAPNVTFGATLTSAGRWASARAFAPWGFAAWLDAGVAAFEGRALLPLWVRSDGSGNTNPPAEESWRALGWDTRLLWGHGGPGSREGKLHPVPRLWWWIGGRKEPMLLPTNEGTGLRESSVQFQAGVLYLLEVS